ncbi:MAG: alpha/beta fold hydrolase [Candidatus Binatia bacterium]
MSAAQAEQAPTDAATYAWIARAMASLNVEPLTPRLGELRCPVLIAVGDKDFRGVGGSVILHREIAGGAERRAQARLVPEDAQRFNRLLLGFLRSLPRA